MATASELMLDALNKAFKAADQVNDPKDRAQIYTELVKACAAAIGTKKDTKVQESEEKVQVPIPKVKVDEQVPEEKPKVQEPEPKPQEAQPKEEIKVPQPEPEKLEPKQEQQKPQAVIDDTPNTEEYAEKKDDPWTNEMIQQYQDEVQTLTNIFRWYQKHSDANEFNELLKECTSGHASTIKDVTPDQINMVISFFKDIFAKAKEI